jgi:hypothetical protein
MHRKYTLECKSHGGYDADALDEECPACADGINVLVMSVIYGPTFILTEDQFDFLIHGRVITRCHASRCGPMTYHPHQGFLLEDINKELRMAGLTALTTNM